MDEAGKRAPVVPLVGRKTSEGPWIGPLGKEIKCFPSHPPAWAGQSITDLTGPHRGLQPLGTQLILLYLPSVLVVTRLVGDDFH